ncbi:hypothetical protein QS257_10260 [Terrilactibacillus sp. S3-3]|nr:hypothetical protein QS257_10260 [Terrilactibacillus sp. S3-3]
MPIVKPHFTATSTVSGNVAVSTSTTVAPTIRRFLAAITLGMIGVGVTTVPFRHPLSSMMPAAQSQVCPLLLPMNTPMFLSMVPRD